MSGRKYVITLLHELVHLRQFVKGTLRTKSGRFHWNNENISHLDYENQPHEIEALEQEAILTQRYYKEIHDVILPLKACTFEL